MMRDKAKSAFRTIGCHYLLDDMPSAEREAIQREFARKMVELYRRWLADGMPVAPGREPVKRRAYPHGELRQLEGDVPPEECRLWELRAASDPDPEDGTTYVWCKRYVGSQEEAEAAHERFLEAHNR